jgi:hypothetical protein
LNTWIPHAINLFKKCGLIDLEDMCHFRSPSQLDIVVHKILRAQVKDGTFWFLKAGPEFFKQRDSVNCGPLASLKMMDVFGRFNRETMLPRNTNTNVIDTAVLRRIVVSDFKSLLNQFSDELFVLKRKNMLPLLGLQMQRSLYVIFASVTFLNRIQR